MNREEYEKYLFFSFDEWVNVPSDLQQEFFLKTQFYGAKVDKLVNQISQAFKKTYNGYEGVSSIVWGKYDGAKYVIRVVVDSKSTIILPISYMGVLIVQFFIDHDVNIETIQEKERFECNAILKNLVKAVEYEKSDTIDSLENNIMFFPKAIKNSFSISKKPFSFIEKNIFSTDRVELFTSKRMVNIVLSTTEIRYSAVYCFCTEQEWHYLYKILKDNNLNIIQVNRNLNLDFSDWEKLSEDIKIETFREAIKHRGESLDRMLRKINNKLEKIYGSQSGVEYIEARAGDDVIIHVLVNSESKIVFPNSFEGIPVQKNVKR